MSRYCHTHSGYPLDYLGHCAKCDEEKALGAHAIDNTDPASTFQDVDDGRMAERLDYAIEALTKADRMIIGLQPMFDRYRVLYERLEHFIDNYDDFSHHPEFRSVVEAFTEAKQDFTEGSDSNG